MLIVMAGAIHKKIFIWNTGFYSEEGFGWHYDMLLLCANMVFLATGGQLVLVRGRLSAIVKKRTENSTPSR